MSRLTEYHNGVAVIKDKRFKEAAEKLAYYEDMEKASMEEIIKSHIEYYERIAKGGLDGSRNDSTSR